MSVRQLRQLLVTMHVLVTNGWLVTALGMAALAILALRAPGRSTTRSALTMSQFLDDNVLVPNAVATAYTGVMLSALTSWGFVRFRWVIAKLAITAAGLYLGIAWINRWLTEAIQALDTDGLGPTLPYTIWGLVLIAALVVALWLGIAKPGGKTRRGGAARPNPETSRLIYGSVLVIPIVDVVLTLYGGLMALTALSYLAYRRTRQPLRTRTDPGDD